MIWIKEYINAFFVPQAHKLSNAVRGNKRPNNMNTEGCVRNWFFQFFMKNFIQNEQMLN